MKAGRHTIVDFLSGLALMALAIVLWWLGLVAVFAVALRLGGDMSGPLVVVGFLGYGLLTALCRRWLEALIF